MLFLWRVINASYPCLRSYRLSELVMYLSMDYLVPLFQGEFNRMWSSSTVILEMYILNRQQESMATFNRYVISV